VNLTRLGRIAHVTTAETDEFPPDCEHCNYQGNPAIAEIYWEPKHTTSSGFTLACRNCVEAVVDNAINDDGADDTVRVVLLQFVPDCDVVDLALFARPTTAVAA
jgi:hypothetical protein